VARHCRQLLHHRAPPRLPPSVLARGRAWLGRPLHVLRARAPLSDRGKERCALALAVSWFSVLSVQSDVDQVDFETLLKNKIVEPDEEQTGWERLAAMYTLDEMGGLTPELEFVVSIGTAGLLFGGSIGALLHSRMAVMKFVERNQATAFESPLMAKRALQDRLTIGLFRGFAIFGWRTAIFTSAFALISTTLMVYTNQISALHYTAAGCVAGGLYKVNMGLRGMVAGATAGSLLGLAGGSVISLACVLSDTTLPKLRYQQYLWKYQQQERDKARDERKREKKLEKFEKKAAEEKAQAEAGESQTSGRVQAASPVQAAGQSPAQAAGQSPAQAAGHSPAQTAGQSHLQAVSSAQLPGGGGGAVAGGSDADSGSAEAPGEAPQDGAPVAAGESSAEPEAVVAPPT